MVGEGREHASNMGGQVCMTIARAVYKSCVILYVIPVDQSMSFSIFQIKYYMSSIQYYIISVQYDSLNS